MGRAAAAGGLAEFAQRGHGLQRASVIGEGEAHAAAGRRLEAGGVELGEQVAHVCGGDRGAGDRSGGLGHATGPGERRRRRRTGGEEPFRRQGPEGHLDLDGRGHRVGRQPGAQHQVGQDADPEHADWAGVAGPVGPPGQLVDGGLARGGQLVGHAGDQLADPVADRAAAHGDRPVRALPAAIGGGGVPGGQLGAQPGLQPADGQRRRVGQHRGLHRGHDLGVGVARRPAQLGGEGAGAGPV
ncbi:MAG TPA: hypothetical protein VLJ85_22410, partial [Geodermatophilus sp.]|nr:hypothetical protein [Geodermatophilus sp.]